MKDFSQKYSVTTIAAVVVIATLIMAGGIYLLVNYSRTNTTAASTSMLGTSSVLTYTNNTYGFTFKYPANWRLTEDTDKKTVKIISDLTAPGDENASVPMREVTMKVVSNDAFGADTKVGTLQPIQYDSSRGVIVDATSNPPRCLVGTFSMDTLTASINIPVVEYGGSGMSSPSYSEFAVLTDKGYIIEILISTLITGNAAQDSKTSSEESEIDSSFSLINGVKALKPNCSSQVTSAPARNLIPAITLIGTPLSMGLYGFGDSYAVMIIGTNFAASSLVSINGVTMGNVPIAVSSDGTVLVFKFYASGPHSNYGPTVTVQVANGHLLSNSKTLTVPNDVRG